MNFFLLRSVISHYLTKRATYKSWRIFDTKYYRMQKRLYQLIGFWFQQPFIVKGVIVTFHAIFSGIIGPTQVISQI